MIPEAEECGNCKLPVPLDTDAEQFCNEDAVLDEAPICSDCLDQSETCIKCGALYWTGIPRPYSDDDAPMSVCGACLNEAVR